MSQPDTSSTNAAQIDTWNHAAGRTWVEFQAQLDAQIGPLGAAALARLPDLAGRHVLDVGCGCGDTTLTLGSRTGSTGSVVGVDVSQPMLEVARERARARGFSHLRFVEADAQVGDLGRAAYDAVYSRFGVMFFADPVAAFRNVHAAMKPGSPLAFVCWRTAAENPWMFAPLEAARPLLPPLPASDPLAPGPTAFADPDRVRAVLGGAGFRDVAVDPLDLLIGAHDLEATTALSLRIGPLGAFLREHPEYRARVMPVVRDSLTPYAAGGVVRMPSATWLVRATA